MYNILVVEKAGFGKRIGEFISRRFNLGQGSLTVLNVFEDDGLELSRLAGSQELDKTMILIAHCNSEVAHAASLLIAEKVHQLLLRMPDKKVAKFTGYDLDLATLDLGVLDNVALLPSISDVLYYNALGVVLSDSLNVSL